MVPSKKFRGVRQRQWGSWVSEIRHPLLKRRFWLGTFESAEQAARAYDKAAVLMNGPNAKTNFPVVKNQNGDTNSPSPVSDILTAKLQKCCKAPSPSLTCLRLDTDNSHIGVWQKRAGQGSGSNWVMRVKLGKNKAQETSPSSLGSSIKGRDGMDEEERDAIQMIEELLTWNCPVPSASNEGKEAKGELLV